jgi:hypothetical protein
MRALFRKPITWMVLAECVVVAALVAVAWQMVTSSRVSSVAVSEAFAPPTASADATTSLPEVADQPALELGPLPGLNLTIGFWRNRLVELNREEAAFERLEWKMVHTITHTVRTYLETVVLPAISRAERGALPRRAP